jgi:hypothetical protein
MAVPSAALTHTAANVRSGSIFVAYGSVLPLPKEIMNMVLVSVDPVCSLIFRCTCRTARACLQQITPDLLEKGANKLYIYCSSSSVALLDWMLTSQKIAPKCGASW